MTPLTAWHGDPAKKKFRIDRVKAHQKADELVQGYGYWKDGKGCAIGCSYHSSDHGLAQTEDGIYTAIALRVDGLFESLPKKEAQTWPLRFFEAIEPGADLSAVWDQNELWVLREYRELLKPEFRGDVDGVIGLYEAICAGTPPSAGDCDQVLDRLDRLASLARLDSLARLASLASLDSLAMLARLASLASLARLAVAESENLLKLLREAPMMEVVA